MRQKGFLQIGLLLLGIVGGLSLCVQAAGIDDLVESDSLERIATGFSFTEGPLWHPDGYLLFSNVPGNKIYKWMPDGTVETFRSPSGFSNGLTFDRQGRLIACEHRNRRISCTELDGTIVTLAGEYDGKRLNSPNDAVVKSDGSIYFTDPPWGLISGYGGPGTQELSFQGVYRLSPDGKTLDLLEDSLSRPNGLAFSPDEKVLYVTATSRNAVYAYDVQFNGLLTNRRVFANASGGPDGMKVDIRGNLYVSLSSGVRVYNSVGMHLGDIRTPASVQNCAFGGYDNRTLFITAGGSVYKVQMKVQVVPDFTPIVDYNGDGIVDCVDISNIVNHWQTDNSLYDIAPTPFGDGIVGVQDLTLLAEYLFQDVNDPTLIAHWALDETEGMFASDSAGDNDAVVVGGASWQPGSGKVDGALLLDGIDGCAITGPALNPADGPFSILAWINGGAPGQVVVSQQSAANWLTLDADGNLMAELTGTNRSTGPLFSETVITDGQWHRIGFVWDGSKRMLYADGVVVAEDTQPGLDSSQMGLYIGTGKDARTGTCFSGLIDDVRIYNRVISP